MKQVTYAVSVGKKPFNWLDFLSRTGHSTEEIEMAVGKASCWPTCAVGNQCAIIPRQETGVFKGRPFDPKLSYLGTYFYETICNWQMTGMDGWRKEAIRTFEKIEIRSQELINQIKTQ